MKITKKLLHKYSSMSVVLRATFWFTVCSVLQRSISMITTPIFTRLMSTDEYGLYSTYLSWLNIFTVCVTLRLEAGVFNKGMSKFKEDRDGYTSAMQGLTTCITTVALVVYLCFYKYFDNLVGLPQYLMVVMFIEIYCVPSYNFWIRRMRYDFKYRNVVAVTLALTVSNAVVGIIAVLLTHGNKGAARVFSVVLVQAVFGISLYIYNLKKNHGLINLKYWKYALKFNIPLLPHYFSLYILQQSDRIMIQKICGYTSVAMYSVVYNFSMVLNTIIDSLNNAVIPWLYRELENKRFDNLRHKVNLLTIMVGGMLFIFILFAPEVMMILAPSSYYEAVYIIPPVSGSLLFIFLYMLLGNIEFFYDYNKITMFVSAFGAILNIALNWIFIRIYGFIAAGYTTFVCYIIFAIAHYIFVTVITKKKESIIIFDTKFLVTFSVIFILLSMGIALLYDHIVLRYSIVLIIAIVCFIKRKYLIENLKTMFGK